MRWQDYKQTCKKLKTRQFSIRAVTMPLDYQASLLYASILQAHTAYQKDAYKFALTLKQYPKQGLSRKQQRNFAGEYTLDLHGKNLDEAYSLLHEQLPLLRRWNVKQVLLIAGKGRLTLASNVQAMLSETALHQHLSNYMAVDAEKSTWMLILRTKQLS